MLKPGNRAAERLPPSRRGAHPPLPEIAEHHRQDDSRPLLRREVTERADHHVTVLDRVLKGRVGLCRRESAPDRPFRRRYPLRNSFIATRYRKPSGFSVAPTRIPTLEDPHVGDFHHVFGLVAVAGDQAQSAEERLVGIPEEVVEDYGGRLRASGSDGTARNDAPIVVHERHFAPVCDAKSRTRANSSRHSASSGSTTLGKPLGKLRALRPTRKSKDAGRQARSATR